MTNEEMIVTLVGMANAGDAIGMRHLFFRDGRYMNYPIIEGRQSARGCTALQVAAKHGHAEIVEILLDAGALVDNSVDVNDWTPLMLAVRHNQNPDVMNLLLSHGADIRHSCGGLDVTEMALRTPVTPLHPDRPADIAQFLADGAKVWKDYKFEEQRGEIVPSLLEQCVDHLVVVASRGEAEIIKNMLDADADLKKHVDDLHFTFHINALHAAVQAGSIAAVQVLLDAGANINIRAAADYRAFTALQFAAGSNLHDMAMFLIEHGADPEIRDREGRTAFDHVRNGNDADARKNLMLSGFRAYIRRKCDEVASRGMPTARDVEILPKLKIKKYPRP